jgi:hypothetical protein
VAYVYKRSYQPGDKPKAATLTRTSSVTADVRAFFTTYCSAFIRQDAPAIAKHFANTIQVASDTGDDVTVHVATAAEWRKTLDHLLEMYRAIGFGWAEATALTCEVISSRLVHAHLRWSLQTAAHEPLYEFDALYILARHSDPFRIIAVAHNEMPQYRRALGRAGRGKREEGSGTRDAGSTEAGKRKP